MKPFHWVVPAVILFLVCFSQSLSATQPRTISYQGFLKDGTGKPVTTPMNLAFRIYSSTRSTSGPIWNENQRVVLTNGVYSVLLGSLTPLDALLFDIPYFLGVSVGGGNELTPRQPLTSTPYAFRASLSDKVSTSSQIVSTVPTGTPPLQVSSTTLAPNLNADLVDGNHAGDFVFKAGDIMTGSLTLPQRSPRRRQPARGQ